MTKIKINNISFLLLLFVIGGSATNIYAQNPNAFYKLFGDKNVYYFRQSVVLSPSAMLVSGSGFSSAQILINTDHSYLELNPTNTDYNIPNYYTINVTSEKYTRNDTIYFIDTYDTVLVVPTSNIMRDGKKYKDNEYAINIYNGLAHINYDQETNKITYNNYFPYSRIKGTSWYSAPPVDSILEGATPTVAGFCFDNEREYVYAFLGLCISKMKADKVDSFLKVYCPPDNAYLGPYSTTYCDFMEVDNEGKIWYAAGAWGNIIAYFDTKTEEFTTYIDTAITLSMPADSFSMHELINLPEKYNNAKIAWGNNYYAKDPEYYEPLLDNWLPYIRNKVLIYENGKWDSIPLPYDLIRQNINGATIQVHCFEKMHKWSDHEIAFSSRDVFPHTWNHSYVDHGLQYEGHNYIFIYDLDTKQWRKFLIPKEYMITAYSSSITNWNDKIYISDNAKNRPLVVYDPALDIDAIDEPNIDMYSSIMISKVYPNPATHNLNVEILYVPTGIYNNDLDVGLYNLMGQKIIDISNIGKYNEYDYTYRARVSIPENLPRGVYYLNVRKGSERRTQAVIIGE
ncbi:MAG: T9SS type A sorting domain-containing protein [Ignavibacteria bacterium]|jgi:hypothetical protein|nr:T9SS type A sorting domain-containing protein [Ignavibacteria bacterium]